MNYYELVGWKNRSEGKVTKVSAERLNHMDNQILANANAIGNIEEIAGLADGTLCGAVKENKTDIETLTSNLEKTNQSLNKKLTLLRKEFSGTTDPNGFISLSLSPTNYIVESVEIVGVSAYFAPIFHETGGYSTRILNWNMETLLPNTKVSGYIYYIEKP